MFSPKLKLAANALNTLRDWGSELRKIKFLIEQTFKWGIWEAEVIGGGTMTVPDLVINYAEYLKIWEFVWFRFDITFTTATAADPYILVKPPVIPAYPGRECFPAWVSDSGLVSGVGLVATSYAPSWFIFQKYNAANWSNAADLRLVSSGFYRAAKAGNLR